MREAKRGAGAPKREVLEYLEVPFRHRWLVVLPIVLCTLAALGASLVLPKKYRSTTLILVEAEKMPESFVPQMATDRVAKRLQTVQQEVLSRTRLERVVQELDPYQTLGTQPLGEIAAGMRKAITVRVRGSDGFFIDFVHADPQMAQRVADRLANLFIGEATLAREKQVTEAFEFIESQLAEARQGLEARETALREYKERHMGSLPEQTTTNLSTLQRMQLEQQALAEQLRAATERLSRLESGGEPADAVSGRRVSLSALRAQLESLRARYTDEHPDVKAARAQIAALEAEIGSAAETGQRASRALETEDARRELERLKARQEENRRRMAELEARVEQAPRTEQELANLTRDFQKLNENYLSLLNKRLDAQMAAKLEQRWRGEQFHILDPADLPTSPFFPNRILFLVLGLVAGLGLGIGAAFAADFIDHSIRTEKELGELLPFTVFATVPYIDPKKEDRLRRRLQAAQRPDDSRRLSPNDSHPGRARSAVRRAERADSISLGSGEGPRRERP
jgi:polysaccharide chain length determinant protein (PEP-CTERM system associated)